MAERQSYMKRVRLAERIAIAHLQLLNLLKILAGAVIVCMFLLIVTDVLSRSVGIKSWQATSALVEYGLLWFTMLAAPALLRQKAHVFIDAITQIFPEFLQRILAKFVYLTCALFSLIISYYSLSLVISSFAQGQLNMRSIAIPQWLLFLPIPLCFLLIAIEFIRFLLGYDSMYGKRTDVKESV